MGFWTSRFSPPGKSVSKLGLIVHQPQFVQVVDHDVGPVAYPEGAAVLHVGKPGGKGAHLVMCLLQGHKLLVADPVTQEIDRPDAVDQEPSVRPAVGNRDVNEGALQPSARNFVTPVVGGVGEFGLQVLVECDVQEGVQRLFSFGPGDFRDAKSPSYLRLRSRATSTTCSLVQSVRGWGRSTTSCFIPIRTPSSDSLAIRSSLEPTNGWTQLGI